MFLSKINFNTSNELGKLQKKKFWSTPAAARRPLRRVHDTYLSIGYKLLRVRSQMFSGAANYSNYKIIIIQPVEDLFFILLAATECTMMVVVRRAVVSASRRDDGHLQRRVHAATIVTRQRAVNASVGGRAVAVFSHGGSGERANYNVSVVGICRSKRRYRGDRGARVYWDRRARMARNARRYGTSVIRHAPPRDLRRKRPANVARDGSRVLASRPSSPSSSRREWGARYWLL